MRIATILAVVFGLYITSMNGDGGIRPPRGKMAGDGGIRPPRGKGPNDFPKPHARITTTWPDAFLRLQARITTTWPDRFLKIGNL